jgi:ABC-type polysaccharide/polyol phosphate export permease
MYAVFLRMLKVPIHRPSLVTGVFVWQFLATCLSDSLQCIVGNANLITKTSFPRAILPFSTVLANLLNFLLSVAVLLPYLAWEGAKFGALGVLPFAALTQFALCLGVSLIVSSANVFFRDTEHIVSVGMLAWFFLSPVVYDLEFIPPWALGLAFLNPMTGILTAYRNALLSMPVPAGASWMTPVSFALAWAVLFAGAWLFQRVQVRFAEEL